VETIFHGTSFIYIKHCPECPHQINSLAEKTEISPDKHDIIFISCSFVLFVVYSSLKIKLFSGVRIQEIEVRMGKEQRIRMYHAKLAKPAK